MRPLELTIQSFGSYGQKTYIDFTRPNQDLFLITGDTGSGKTTLFDAIVFALYGQASSMRNKKEGIELQSQYSVERPFVKLRFQCANQDYEIYRQPRYSRKKKRGQGWIQESEIIELTMPDGSIYPQKETNKKIEEIVGLNKGQFMQVAMIAQGEFMDVLRAKSEDKKQIFRKLFHTEFYQKIVDSIASKSKFHQNELDKWRIQVQVQLGNAQLEQQELKNKIMTSDSFSITDFEECLEQIEADILNTSKHFHDLDLELKQAKITLDQRNEENTKGQELFIQYEQFEKSVEQLKQFEKEEDDIKNKKSLVRDVELAFQIKQAYTLWSDQVQKINETKTDLKLQKDNVSKYNMSYSENYTNQEKLRKQLDRAIQKHSTLKKEVEDTLRIFNQLETIEIQMNDLRVDDNEKEKQNLESQIAQNQKLLDTKNQEYKSFESLDKDIALWNEKRKKILEFKEKEQQLIVLDKEIKEGQQVFKTLSYEYNHLREDYEMNRQNYLNEQAGILAQQLKINTPCPVCGSLDHPHPRRIDSAKKVMNQEELDLLRQKSDELRDAQEKKNIEVKVMIDRKESLEKDCSLYASIEKYVDQEEKITNEFVQKEEQRVQIHHEIQILEDALGNLQEALKASVANFQEKQERLTRLLTMKEQWVKQLHFETKEKAQSILSSSNKELEKLQEDYDRSVKTTSEYKKAVDQCETLIQKYEVDLPLLEEKQKELFESFKDINTLKNWEQLSEAYTMEYVDLTFSEIETYEKELNVLKGKIAQSKEMIHGRTKPDLDSLRTTYEVAQTTYQKVAQEFENVSQRLQNNQKVYNTLRIMYEKRQGIVQDAQNYEELYQRLAGKMTGSRMDIETYVQRYYLEKILDQANQHFTDMSGGQFELRMYDLQKAGEGKNRGLDLMVYSSVTDQVREVRTLSGGESFMAALSLALGMADEIQLRSSAIQLDMMFIDEGFGSLDEHSRSQAIRVLQNLTGQSKLIGIISHVSELKQEVEDQLIVTKDENGSHVEWQIS